MEKLEKNIVEIFVNSKDITADVSQYLSQTTYTDKEEAESDDVSLVFENTSGIWIGNWYPDQGDTMQIRIGTGSPRRWLDCGLFEIDDVQFEFPPDTVTVKAIAAGITKQLRTRNSKAYEKQSLLQIAQHIAGKHGLELVANIGSLASIILERKTQERQTDLSFLASLAREYGLIFSVRGGQLVFYDSTVLDGMPAAFVTDKTQMSTGRFSDKTSEVYAGAVAVNRNTRTNELNTWQASNEGIASSDLIMVHSNTDDAAQAEAQATRVLKKTTNEKITGNFSTDGNTDLVAGINTELTGIGKMSGKWHVTGTTHTVTKDGGYTTNANARKVI